MGVPVTLLLLLLLPLQLLMYLCVTHLEVNEFFAHADGCKCLLYACICTGILTLRSVLQLKCSC
jgi:hypothetical protein